MLSLFRELGFSEKEMQVYLQLVQVGKSTAQLLARRAKLPRTTVYSTLEGLTDKGLIAEERSSGATFFVVNKPSALLRGVEAETVRLKQKESAARSLIDQIQPLFKSRLFGTPKMQFFDGAAGVENMLYDHFDDWQKSAREAKQGWCTVLHRSFLTRHRGWLDTLRERSAAGDARTFFTESGKPDAALRGGTIHKITSALPIGGSTIVAGDFAVFITSHEEPHYAFELRDGQIAATLRVVLDMAIK